MVIVFSGISFLFFSGGKSGGGFKRGGDVSVFC